MLKESKQQEMLQKLHEVDVERTQHVVDRFREFQELLQASEPEMTDGESSRVEERDRALYDAISNYAGARSGNSPNPQWASDASEALDRELEEMRMTIEGYIETEDG